MLPPSMASIWISTSRSRASGSPRKLDADVHWYVARWREQAAATLFGHRNPDLGIRDLGHAPVGRSQSPVYEVLRPTAGIPQSPSPTWESPQSVARGPTLRVCIPDRAGTPFEERTASRDQSLEVDSSRRHPTRERAGHETASLSPAHSPDEISPRASHL